VTYQHDSFHGISHRLGDTCRILYQKAAAATKAEYEQEANFVSAKEGELESKYALYEQVVAASQKAVDLYDDYRIYYRYMVEQLNLFDEQGNVRSHKTNQANLEEAIAVMASLEHASTNKALKTIKKLVKEGLLNFQKEAAKVVYHLEQSCSSAAQRAALKKICRAYHYLKRDRKSKNREKKAYFKEQQTQWLLQGKACWEQTEQQPLTYEAFQQYTYAQLAQIVQSSALVETINSIVRLYLNNSKNQTTQQHLNLIMFYHNHRRYVQGVRKNHTPMELLTGRVQEQDWLDLLVEKVATSDKVVSALRVASLAEAEELLELDPCCQIDA